MLEIGRAMLLRPRLLLIDEPSVGLSPLLVQQVFGLMRQLHGRRHDRVDDRAERQVGIGRERLRNRSPTGPGRSRRDRHRGPRAPRDRTAVPRRRRPRPHLTGPPHVDRTGRSSDPNDVLGGERCGYRSAGRPEREMGQQAARSKSVDTVGQSGLDAGEDVVKDTGRDILGDRRFGRCRATRRSGACRPCASCPGASLR